MSDTRYTLPADLPVTWTRGQVVAPDGVAVGLSEQHGFNYLCRQVNEAQRVINAQGVIIEELRGELAGKADKDGTVQENLNAQYWNDAELFLSLTDLGLPDHATTQQLLKAAMERTKSYSRVVLNNHGISDAPDPSPSLLTIETTKHYWGFRQHAVCTSATSIVDMWVASITMPLGIPEFHGWRKVCFEQ